MDKDKIKFKKILFNLPEKIRNEDIIVVVDDKPYTWNVAYFEVNNESEIGKKILKRLKVMEII